MPQIIPVDSVADILPRYRDTPIERLLRYHNLGEHLPAQSTGPRLLVGMCMDYRKGLVIPREFAFVIRAAGGNLRDHAFDISFGVAIGGVTTIALLAHTDCGMVRVRQKREAFIRGLVTNGGWDGERAARHFDDSVFVYEIDDSVAFILSETRRLRAEYPAVMVAPLLYQVEDDRLAQLVD